MKFRIPRKLKKILKKYKWTCKETNEEVKPWSSQEMLDRYKTGNLEFMFWNSQSKDI